MSLRQTEPVVVKIRGKDFYITPFPAFKAANLIGELASVLAPLLGVIAPFLTENNGDDKSGSLGDVDLGEAAKAMSGCTAFSGDKLELLMRKLLLGGNIAVETENDIGEIEAQRLNADLVNELFCGELQDMFILCFHVIRLNYGGFFKKLAAPSGAEKQEEAKEPRKIL